jgi:phenylpropionate dioxygenase-like ring-hydroxylating dioxygenase large terminal subunit
MDRIDDFVPGSTALETDGPPAPQEVKSPPLHQLRPDIAQYRRIDPAPFRDPDWLARERDALWRRRWLCAGVARDAAEPGQWFSFDIAGEGFIVTRGRDGALHAFHNVCPHRGTRLVEGDFGTATGGRFVCAFHSWSFGLDGRNIGVTDRRFFEAEALCGSIDLAKVRVAEWDGFIFICQDEDAPPLQESLGEIAEHLAAYRFADMQVVKDAVVDLPANWKLVLHANLEAYHFHALHPEALPFADDLIQQIDFYPGGHSRFITPTGIPSSRLPPREKLSDEQKWLLAEVGINGERFTGGSRAVRRALQDAKRQTDNIFGLDYSRYSDNQLTDDWSIAIFPNMSLNAHPEGVLFMRYLPDPRDPARCRFHVMVLAPPLAPGARPPGYMGVEEDADLSGARRAERRYADASEPGLGWALDADCRIVAQVQRGMESSGFSSLRLGELEQRIQHFQAEYAACMEISRSDR